MKKLVIILVIVVFLLGGCAWHTPRGCQDCSESIIYDSEYKIKYRIKSSPTAGTKIYDKNHKLRGKIK